MFSNCFKLIRVVLLFPVILSLLFGITSCGGATGSNQSAGSNALTVLSVVGGKVQIQKGGSAGWNDAKEGISLVKGDKIKTDSLSTATITFFDGSIIELNSGTEISLDELTGKSASASKLIKIGQTIGETRSNIVKLIDQQARYDIETPSGVAAVRGSKMVVSVVADGSASVYNVEGAISFTAQGKEVLIPVGQVSSAKPGAVPSVPQPGIPPVFGGSNTTSISATAKWQETGLYLNKGDQYYIYYRGGSWTVNNKTAPYVGPDGYSSAVDKTITPGRDAKIDSSVPYGYLLGMVGQGNVILIGNQEGPFTADANGFLNLRINEVDSELVDNDGAITVVLRTSVYSAFKSFYTLTGNPNDSWSYGWMPADFSKFNLYTLSNFSMWYGQIGTDLTPYIWDNDDGLDLPPGVTSNGTTAAGVPVGWLSLHPGPNKEPSVLRWTAPVAGSVNVTGEFLAGDTGIMTIAVHHNNNEIWKATDAGKFNLNVNVATGDTIDFMVYGGYGHGNTPINANIKYSN